MKALITTLLLLAPPASADDRDPVESQMYRGGERPSTYFFVGFDDCMERLALPNADPADYCRQRFPRATAAVAKP